MSALSKLTASETKLFLREPLAVFFVVAFPAILLVIIGSIPAFREYSNDLGGHRFVDLYFPIMIAMGVAMTSLNGLPQRLATYRERGILRRLAVTPVQPQTMLGALLLMCAGGAAASAVLATVIGRIAFSVPLPSQFVGYVLAFVLLALAMLSIGLVVAAIAPNGKAAGAIGSILFFPLMFFAGLWLPRQSMPGLLRTISDYSPLGAGVQALQDAVAGQWPQPLHLLVMLGWVLVAGSAAIKFFRWE